MAAWQLDNPVPLDPLATRDEFPVLAEQTYLISASLGPLSNRSRRELDRILNVWATVGSPEVFWFETIFPMVDRVKDLLGNLIGASKESLALAHNVSTAISSIATLWDDPTRPKVVIGGMDFVTGHHVWQAHQRRGIQISIVESPDGISIPAQAYVDAIDESTWLVQINRVLFHSGAILDIDPIVRKAREVGAYVLIDDFHGTGVVPINAFDVCDFYVTGVLKWLLGGGGLAFLGIRPGLESELDPLITGWFSNAPGTNFSRDRSPADDARKFETGTFAAPVIPIAMGGLELVNEVGVATIRARHQELTEMVVAEVDRAGLKLLSPRDASKRGGMVRFAIEDSQKIFRQLLERKIVVDERAGGLRVGPHFFNTEREIETLFAAVHALR
jgi:kynureninase